MQGKDGGEKQMFSAIDHFYQLGAFLWPIQSSDLKKKKHFIHLLHETDVLKTSLLFLSALSQHLFLPA